MADLLTTSAEEAIRPGGEEARKQGCRCPILDNARGRGAYTDAEGKPVFWVSADCPLHGLAPRAEKERKP